MFLSGSPKAAVAWIRSQTHDSDSPGHLVQTHRVPECWKVQSPSERHLEILPRAWPFETTNSSGVAGPSLSQKMNETAFFLPVVISFWRLLVQSINKLFSENWYDIKIVEKLTLHLIVSLPDLRYLDRFLITVFILSSSLLSQPLKTVHESLT